MGSGFQKLPARRLQPAACRRGVRIFCSKVKRGRRARLRLGSSLASMHGVFNTWQA